MSILKCNGKIFVLSSSLLTWNAISIPTVTSNLTYTGDIQSPTITGYDENTMTMEGKTNGTNAGTYEITFTPKSGYQWDDGTSETKRMSWSIAKAPRNARVITSSPIVINTNSTEVVVKIDDIYTTPVDPVVSNSQVATATFMGFMQGLANINVTKVGPGTCTVTVNAAETTNYLATSCSFDVACYATVEVPSQSGTLTFMDSAYQTPTWNNYNSAYLTIGGTTEARSAGTYTATFTPIAPYATWTDGSSDTKNVNWTIGRATISTPYLVNTNVFTYTGDTIIPQFIGYNSQKMSRGGTTAAINAGHYAATFTPYDNYQWPGGDTGTIEVGWHISKAAGSLSLSTNSLTIDANSTTASFTVTRAGDGAISATSSNTDVATVSVSGNTVTVTKVWRGSATIRVFVAEGTNHTAPASKTCTVTTSFKPTASTVATSGVNYTSGLSDVAASDVTLFAEAISNNSSITNATSTVYIDFGRIHRKVSVGDQVTLALNVTNYTFDVIGFNHDTLTDANAYGSTTATGKAGITFQMHDLFAKAYEMNKTSGNSGGWRSSAMRNLTMATMKEYLPAAWQTAIKPVNKVSGTGGGSSRSTETVSDSCFLLAEIEIFGSTTYSVSGEGTQYAYYKAGNSKVKKKDSRYGYWWERSPRSGYSLDFCSVSSDGTASYSAAKYG